MGASHGQAESSHDHPKQPTHSAEHLRQPGVTRESPASRLPEKDGINGSEAEAIKTAQPYSVNETVAFPDHRKFQYKVDKIGKIFFSILHLFSPMV